MWVDSELFHVDRPEALFLPLLHDHRLHELGSLALESMSLRLLAEGPKRDCVWLYGFRLHLLFLLYAGQGLFEEFKLESVQGVS